jgi:heme exporter protein B
MLKAFWFLFYAEFILRMRRSQEWLYPLAFFIMMISLFPLALSPNPLFLQKYIPGSIWMAALLASLLSIESIFYADKKDGYLEQLLLCQTPLSLLILAKLAAQWIASQLPILLLTPFMGWLFHFSFNTMTILFLSLLLGTPILTCVGSLGAALTLGLRQHGVLLSLLILPLVLPVLILGVSVVQTSTFLFSTTGPLALLAGMMLLSISLLPFVIAFALRIGVEN